MSELQKQAMEIIEEMSEENLKVLVKFMQIFIQPSRTSCEGTDTHSVKKPSKRIGIAEGEELYAADYDIDEYNGEIAKMFGGGIMKVLLDTHIVL
ncbi:MAG: hypothetical protein K1W22_06340 [Lachnospiraceae bacterium]